MSQDDPIWKRQRRRRLLANLRASIGSRTFSVRRGCANAWRICLHLLIDAFLLCEDTAAQEHYDLDRDFERKYGEI